jgi:hypothetical protein
MGFVTTNLKAAQAAAKKLSGFEVSEIVDQEWGMSDFRLLTPEGYYFRITTPDPDEP